MSWEACLENSVLVRKIKVLGPASLSHPGQFPLLGLSFLICNKDDDDDGDGNDGGDDSDYSYLFINML